MVVDIDQYLSHPDKKLIDHIDGVLRKTKSRTTLKIAALAAIFHDVGKLNPNFQKKMIPNQGRGYSNHAYLSAYAFLSFCMENEKDVLNLVDQQASWLASILTIVAHHHGDIPNYPHILREEEFGRLIQFLETEPLIPASEVLSNFMIHNDFNIEVAKPKDFFREKLQLKLANAKHIPAPLDHFLSTRFAFASVIAADKQDAGGYVRENDDSRFFQKQYNVMLKKYLEQLAQNTELNKLRTLMRNEAQKNIQLYLKNEKRIFSLTAPTGSGKTLMLLTLAGEILKKDDSLRIIYTLPFLSIIEQVEKECRKIFKNLDDAICRIDSKSDNIDFSKYQNILDNDPSALSSLLGAQFSEDTFDYPFVITTFVRVFETFLTNKNSLLLKLPNFANSIFLIDEIQALPPRLYGFFVALLDAFCRKFNSYAILSTATMPNFELPLSTRPELENLFPNYINPPELSDFKYFQNSLFNRYVVERKNNAVNLDELAEMIVEESESVLVILNTIQDTKNLFGILEQKNKSIRCELLNTHFTPSDRKKKISKCKSYLENGDKVILISTQLIEAGVDIDFPIVYRDFCPLPSIIQSAGRCNRNGQLDHAGCIKLIDLQNNGKSRSNLIYRGKDSRFLNYAYENITSKEVEEPDLFQIQKYFFEEIKDKTLWGYHFSDMLNNGEMDLVQKIKEMKFVDIGKFKLIDEKYYGESKRYYIVRDEEDYEFEYLNELLDELKKIDFHDFDKRKIKLIELDAQIRKMADNSIQVMIKSNESAPPASDAPCCGLLKLSREYYDEISGLIISGKNQIL